MFDWLKQKGQESLKNNFKIKIDECGDKLDLSLKYYYKNSFQDNKLKINKNGIERFYLFMCFAFGYLYDDLNEVGADDELGDYFIQYIPSRIFLNKLDLEISKEVFQGYDISANNLEGLSGGFAYAGSIIASKTCSLSNSAARTGGHMINSHNNRYTIIQVDKNYANFRKLGSLYRDGDKVVSGLQLVFDNNDLSMHKLKIN
jgi:hypothetical protein